MNAQTTAKGKVDHFRALHGRVTGFVIPNAWDAGSARILTRLGFEAIATTSAGMAWTLGVRDGAARRQQAIENAHSIVSATSLPVSADLENGYGPRAEDVFETIQNAGAIGLAGASIEDASGDDADPIYDTQRALERIAAAVEANRSVSAPMVLTARAENFLHGRPNLDDTIRRLVAYREAGADVVYAPGLPSLDAVKQLCEAVHGPVNVLAGSGQSPWSVADIIAAGARRVSVGSAFARAALGRFIEAADEVRERGTFTFAVSSPSHMDVNRLMAGA